MSASPLAADVCPSCGGRLPSRARFCPECGAPLEEPANRTLQEDMPTTETGPVPITLERAEPRWFGVAPPYLLLGLAGVALAAAIALFAAGRWPYGLILLGIAALLLAAFLEAARRRPHSRVARRSFDARERARSSWESWRLRSAAIAESHRLQGRLARLDTERRSALFELGQAAYGGDAGAEAAVRARLADLDAQEGDVRRQLHEQREGVGEMIRRVRLPVEDTMMVTPPQPAQPPGEGTPPEPARIPEPYPPPDEGNPPEPARIPEPTPDQPRREPDS